MKAEKIILLRKISQAMFFVFFLLLLTVNRAQSAPQNSGNLFFFLDPLLAIVSWLGGKIFVASFFLYLITFFGSWLLGRAWCGWICPMGSILEWITPGKKNRKVRLNLEGSREVKYIILLIMIVLGLLGSQAYTFLDPITLLHRTSSQIALPMAQAVINGLESFLYRFEPLWGALDWIHARILLPVFHDKSSSFQLALPLLLFFITIVGLNWVVERFWCRYLCPLGGLFGLVSKLTPFKRVVTPSCTSCRRCAGICPTGTIDIEDGFKSDPSECIICFECIDACKYNANALKMSFKNWKPAEWKSYDPTRRDVLAGLGLAVGSLGLAAIETSRKSEPATIIRPPGSETKSLERVCIRCGQCINVCPTQGLQPSGIEGGWYNLFTPRLIPRLGYCDYNCTACSQICPTQAIHPISLDEKREITIGLARIDRDRCLPWAYATACIICEEACPLPDKAVKLQEDVISHLGSTVILKRPFIVRENCIGCGICEHQCPLAGEAAIRVYSPTKNINTDDPSG